MAGNVRGKGNSTILFADDHTVLAKSEDELQRTVHSLEKVAEEYEVKISVPKTKVMALNVRK